MNAQRIGKLKLRLQKARAELLKAQPDFAQPLRELIYVATKDVYRISTNGFCIYFDPDWLQKLEENSLVFMLAHVLGHLEQKNINRPKYFSGDRYHLAADITVNARLRIMGWQHEKLPGVGKIYDETFFPRCDGAELTAEEAMDGVPFDPSALPEGKRRRYMIDSDRWWDASSDRGETGVVVLRPGEPDPFDLPVSDVNFGNARKVGSPIKREGQTLVLSDRKQQSGSDAKTGSARSWERSAASSVRTLRSMKREQQGAADSGEFRERLWQKPNQPGLDWRTLLNSFIREDIFDYSFSPPDRRYQEDALFLPDFNVPAESVKDVLFLVDTSGSVSEQMLSAVYRELSGALEQFDGSLSGVLGFFDTQVRKVCPFRQIDDLRAIVPVGGGGTDFDCVFSYCENRRDEPPCYIVIFTDGDAHFPDVSAARDIPVLWLFTKATAVAPWGKYAYIPTDTV